MWKTQRRAKASPFGSNGDDRRQRRKQGGAVGAAASRMQATAKQTLGAATRAVALRSNDGEGKLVIKESPYSDEQGLSQREHIAALYAHGQRPCPLSPRCAMPLPGLRLPESASLSLASCWPLPQQLLPASAAGGGRRRCSQRESLYEWMVGKMIFTAKKPFCLSVVRVPLYFWTMRFVTLTA